MTKTVMIISWAPGEGYSITQGEPPVDMLEMAAARLARAEAAIQHMLPKQRLMMDADSFQSLLAERRIARRDVDILKSIAGMLEAVCDP